MAPKIALLIALFLSAPFLLGGFNFRDGKLVIPSSSRNRHRYELFRELLARENFAFSPPLKMERLNYTPPIQIPVTEQTYIDLLTALWQKAYLDIQKYLGTALHSSKHSLAHILEKSSEVFSSCVQSFLWAIVLVWTYALWVFCYWTVEVIITNTMLIIAVGLLMFCTVFMVKALHWLFGDFFNWTVVPVFRCLVYLWKLRSLKVLAGKTQMMKEKMTKGFGSYDMMMSPPKSSVLEVLHDDEQHCGYASCILLADGTVGLLTSQHVAEDAYWIKSHKTGNKIKFSEFKPLIKSQKGDITILVGPPNWQGLLGCSAVLYVTMKNLSVSDARIYYRKEGDWYSGVAKLMGPNLYNFVDVLSNTEPGYSGTPYFNGNKIVGVHTGGASNTNCNVMAAIPHIEGLTASKYIYETTAPKGKIFDFDDELWNELMEDFSVAESQYLYNKIKNVEPECSMNLTMRGDQHTEQYRVNDAFSPECTINMKLRDPNNGREARIRSPEEHKGCFPDRAWVDCNHDLSKEEIEKFLSHNLGIDAVIIPRHKQFLCKDCDVDLRESLGDWLSTKIKPPVQSEDWSGAEFHDAPTELKTTKEEWLDEISFETSKKANLNGERGTDLVKTGEGCTQKNKSDDGDTVQRVIEALVAKMNVSQLEERVVEVVSKKISTPPVKKQRRRGKRGGGNKQTASTTSSAPNTTGKYLPPQKRSQASKPAAKSPNTTIQSKNNKENGERKSSPNTQKWVRKSKDLGGQSSARKLN
ncbi:RNA-dependent RNA polymerase P1 protein [White clover mottle virus]|uniref:RNA-dependent RNA polymerase P1 protein n=1 Tax=White clover mottle virus TaxID=1913024 RepID=A0A1J1DKN5_9VIRU|nr:RNA-dependent RNA polymerase P1 protein [White clover mottle virus]BAV90575.1 RNA-dependent RNA polymerase P1 protein [White clover mottle virus]